MVCSLVLCRYYSLFTLGMLVMFESTVVTQRLRNLKELRSLQTPKQPIMVYRQGKWDKLPGDALLPGDVISIGRPAGGEDLMLPNYCRQCTHHLAAGTSTWWWPCAPSIASCNAWHARLLCLQAWLLGHSHRKSGDSLAYEQQAWQPYEHVTPVVFTAY